MWCFYALFQRCVSTMESSLNKEPLGKMGALWTVSVKMERLVSTDVTKGILFFNLDTHDKALYGSWFSVSKNMPFKWWRADIYDQQIYNVYFFVLVVEQVLTLNTVWKQSPRIPKARTKKHVLHEYTIRMSYIYTCIMRTFYLDDRCARFDSVPAGCTMTTDPKDSCCRIPVCAPQPATTLAPVPGNPAPTPNPNPTPPQVPVVTGSIIGIGRIDWVHSVHYIDIQYSLIFVSMNWFLSWRESAILSSKSSELPFPSFNWCWITIMT